MKTEKEDKKFFHPVANDAELPYHLAWLVNIERKAVIPSKWTLLITSYILAVIQWGNIYIPALIFGLLVLYGLCNLFYSYLYYFRRYQRREILPLSYLSLAADIVVVTLLIYLTGIKESHGTLRSDFYLLYFLIILRGIVLFPNKTISLIVNLIISLLYVFTLVSTEQNLFFLSSYLFISKMVLIWAVMLICWFILEIVGSQRDKILADLDQMRTMEEQIIRTEKLASMGEVAAGIAHEINNPIGIITASADFLLKTNQLSTTQRDTAQVIQTEATRCKKIIHQLVQLTSPTANAVEPVDVNAIIGDTILEIRNQQIPEKILISTQLDPQLVSILANPSLLQRAIYNLVRNATEAMPTGGEIKIITANNGNKDWIKVQISDSGLGIGPDELKHIFTPFFTTKTGNLGLGLAITHRVIDWHGGNIKVDSQLGAGTIFTISLPIKRGSEK